MHMYESAPFSGAKYCTLLPIPLMGTAEYNIMEEHARNMILVVKD